MSKASPQTAYSGFGLGSVELSINLDLPGRSQLLCLNLETLWEVSRSRWNQFKLSLVRFSFHNNDYRQFEAWGRALSCRSPCHLGKSCSSVCAGSSASSHAVEFGRQLKDTLTGLILQQQQVFQSIVASGQQPSNVQWWRDRLVVDVDSCAKPTTPTFARRMHDVPSGQYSEISEDSIDDFLEGTGVDRATLRLIPLDPAPRHPTTRLVTPAVRAGRVGELIGTSLSNNRPQTADASTRDEVSRFGGWSQPGDTMLSPNSPNSPTGPDIVFQTEVPCVRAEASSRPRTSLGREPRQSVEWNQRPCEQVGAGHSPGVPSPRPVSELSHTLGFQVAKKSMWGARSRKVVKSQEKQRVLANYQIHSFQGPEKNRRVSRQKPKQAQTVSRVAPNHFSLSAGTSHPTNVSKRGLHSTAPTTPKHCGSSMDAAAFAHCHGHCGGRGQLRTREEGIQMGCMTATYRRYCKPLCLGLSSGQTGAMPELVQWFACTGKASS
mmetsp:Transcript_62652/g.136201  ORF Transcript_62652/g.136201 Transcript_62652/m.136201 type:complete len:492 (-) Transcript_62652:424-1899(-)